MHEFPIPELPSRRVSPRLQKNKTKRHGDVRLTLFHFRMLPLPRKPSENYPYYNDNGKRALLGANPKETKILCTPGTETFIKLKRTFHSDNLLADKSDKDIQSRLAMLPANAIKHIWEYHLNKTGAGDGVINGNRQSVGWIWERVGYFGFYKLQVANAHRRRFIPFGTAIGGNEVTWGVLKAALLALTEYMVKDTIYGWTECSFEIWDGRNQVGAARIVPGLAPNKR